MGRAEPKYPSPAVPVEIAPAAELLGSVAGVSLEEIVYRQLRLRAAVLIEAIRCLEGTAGSRRDRVHLQRQALRWFRDNGSPSPFSFLRVCESLGLDPSRVRRRIFLLPSRRRTDVVTQVIARGLDRREAKDSPACARGA